MKLLFGFYRLVISPALHLMGGGQSACRFDPSCSLYAQEALREHGLLKGSWLALWRILRCQPFAKSGYDPVPHAIGRPNRTN